MSGRAGGAPSSGGPVPMTRPCYHPRLGLPGTGAEGGQTAKCLAAPCLVSIDMYRQNAVADRISTAFPRWLHRRCAVTSRSSITLEGELAAAPARQEAASATNILPSDYAGRSWPGPLAANAIRRPGTRARRNRPMTHASAAVSHRPHRPAVRAGAGNREPAADQLGARAGCRPARPDRAGRSRRSRRVSRAVPVPGDPGRCGGRAAASGG